MQEKEIALLEAARKIFLEKGFKSTNISMITKEAGIAVGSFYNYFESKEDIFLKLYEKERLDYNKKMLSEIDWNQSLEKVLENLLLTFKNNNYKDNKILVEWDGKNLGKLIKEKLYNNKNCKSQYDLRELLLDKAQKEGYSKEESNSLIQIYDLIVIIDTKITDEDIDNKYEILMNMISLILKGLKTK